MDNRTRTFLGHLRGPRQSRHVWWHRTSGHSVLTVLPSPHQALLPDLAFSRMHPKAFGTAHNQLRGAEQAIQADVSPAIPNVEATASISTPNTASMDQMDGLAGSAACDWLILYDGRDMWPPFNRFPRLLYVGTKEVIRELGMRTDRPLVSDLNRQLYRADVVPGKPCYVPHLRNGMGEEIDFSDVFSDSEIQAPRVLFLDCVDVPSQLAGEEYLPEDMWVAHRLGTAHCVHWD